MSGFTNLLLVGGIVGASALCVRAGVIELHMPDSFEAFRNQVVEGSHRKPNDNPAASLIQSELLDILDEVPTVSIRMYVLPPYN